MEATKERISRYLEAQSEPVSWNAIRKSVGGKHDRLRRARDTLVREGYVEMVDGRWGARFHRSRRPFRAANPHSLP